MECQDPLSIIDEECPPRKKIRYDAESRSFPNLLSLPPCIILKIISFLDQNSINRCAMVCSTLNSICSDSSLYETIVLKYKMPTVFLGSLVTKTSRPRKVYIEYKYEEQNAETEDNFDFDEWVQILFQKCSEYIVSITIHNCHNDRILLYIGDCINLEDINLIRCKGSFGSLPLLKNLKSITFTHCHFAPRIVSDVVRNNEKLKTIRLMDNTNINGNEICEIMSKCNPLVEEIDFSERKQIKSKSLRTLARLTRLKSLSLLSTPGGHSDPEDVLEQIAAGCPNLEKLVIYGWQQLTDDNLIPALHICTQLKDLDIREANITIRSCREAALSLPLLESIDVFKCNKIKKSQLVQLQKDFNEIRIAIG